MINPLPTTRTALVIDGDALLVVRVRIGLRRVCVVRSNRIENFLSASVETVRTTLGDTALAKSGDLVLVLPPSWAASRPVPIDSRSWRSAKEARDELVEAYFPFDAPDALAGVLDTEREQQGDESSGAIFVASCAQVEPWRERLEQIFGRTPGETIASTMALAGLGLQSFERAVVTESADAPIATTLSWGRPVDVGSPYDGTDEPDGAAFVVGDGPAPRGSTRVSLEELAVAACALPFVPGVKYRALGSEQGSRLDRRVPLVACLALVAILGLALSMSVSDARYRAAIADLQDRMSERSDELTRVQMLRNRTTEMASLIERVNEATGEWSSVLPELRGAFATVGAEGFVHRVELSPTRLVLQGESADALSVLEALENTDAFTRARQSGSIMQTDRELETFSIEARRQRTEGSAE